MTDPSELIARLSDIRVEGGNEAETRFQVIDKILCGVLGWQDADLTIEKRLSEDGKDEFADYLLKTAQTSLLIEAKRAQVDFSKLPLTRRAALKGSWLKGEVRKAVIQARDYGRKLGVGFCAVTNGDAWIIFPVNRRDMVSFDETHAIIFRGARQALDADLDEFRSILSREAVIDGSLEQGLLGGDSNQVEGRRLNRIYDKSFSRVERASLFGAIEDEIVTAFSEELIADNPELLAKSYVETPDRLRFDDRVKMSVLRREQVINTRPIRPIGKGGIKVITEKVRQIQIRPRPVALLTLGLVGAGKTTFLNYIEKVSAKDTFDRKAAKREAFWLYIDFRDYSKSKSPRDYMFEGIFDYIKVDTHLNSYEHTLRHAYKADIKALTEGPLALFAKNEEVLNTKIADILVRDFENKQTYCEKILSYIASRQPVYLVIDNVDQIEELSIQSDIFLEALAIARQSRLNLVLAMRDATYVRNRSSAVFDAFDFDAIYIDPPDIQSVLSKRFTIAEHLLNEKHVEFESDGGAKVTIDDASQVVALLSSSVLGTEVGNLIEVTSTGDVRLALQMTRQFLQFGHSSSYRAYRTFQETGKYSFPPHEALRAIMFGNQGIYRDEFSPILNPFDAKTGRSESQFLRIYIMNALVSAASTKTFQGIEAGEITAVIEKLGFSQRVSNKIIGDLIRARACFSRSHQTYNAESVLVPTRLSGYILRELIGKFVFLETTVFDTFIYDDKTWAEISTQMKRAYSENRSVEKLKHRKIVARTFFDWCEREVQSLCDHASARNLGPFWTTNPLTRARVDFEKDIDRALRSAMRNFEPGGNLEGLPVFREERGQ